MGFLNLSNCSFASLSASVNSNRSSHSCRTVSCRNKIWNQNVHELATFEWQNFVVDVRHDVWRKHSCTLIIYLFFWLNDLFLKFVVVCLRFFQLILHGSHFPFVVRQSFIVLCVQSSCWKYTSLCGQPFLMEVNSFVLVFCSEQERLSASRPRNHPYPTVCLGAVWLAGRSAFRRRGLAIMQSASCETCQKGNRGKCVMSA